MSDTNMIWQQAYTVYCHIKALLKLIIGFGMIPYKKCKKSRMYKWRKIMQTCYVSGKEVKVSDCVAWLLSAHGETGPDQGCHAIKHTQPNAI